MTRTGPIVAQIRVMENVRFLLRGITLEPCSTRPARNSRRARLRFGPAQQIDRFEVCSCIRLCFILRSCFSTPKTHP